MKRLFQWTFALFLASLFSLTVNAQQLYFSYSLTLEPAMVTEQPQIGGLEVDFPAAARKSGVEGTVKATFVFGEDGSVRDIKVLNDLGEGTGAAVEAALQKLYFKPARYNGKPTPVNATINYTVSVIYDANDSNLEKVKIIDQPDAVYPETERAAGTKGKVSVQVLFLANGEIKVLGASSVMEKPFDKAAIEAARKIKFEPAVQKKTKRPVSQQMMVDYNFKP